MQATPETVEHTVTESARRTQIVAAAIEAIAELGYANTSFTKIAKRAGLSSTGLISYHFTNKYELLEQVVRTVYQAGAEYVTPRIQAEETAPTMLAACLRANVEFIRDHGKDIAAVNEVVLSLRAAGTLRVTEASGGDELILDGIQAILRKGQADGEFRDFDTRTMAWVVRNAIDGVNQQRALNPHFDFDACIRELTDLFHRATAWSDPQ